jgi:FixJ family two-component response regulator
MSKTNISIAVVDDDASFARALGRLLRAAGFEVLTYPSGEAFLEAKTQPPPDCLVFDIQLGSGMDGVELLHKVRGRGNFTPVIFVTAHDAVDVREQALHAGCAAYLRKPVASRTLLEAVSKAMKCEKT